MEICEVGTEKDSLILIKKHILLTSLDAYIFSFHYLVI